MRVHFLVRFSLYCWKGRSCPGNRMALKTLHTLHAAEYQHIPLNYDFIRCHATIILNYKYAEREDFAKYTISDEINATKILLLDIPVNAKTEVAFGHQTRDSKTWGKASVRTTCRIWMKSGQKP
ncbi:hypothetical protein RCL_jg18462.t1 [Rhizophagus clarus]|uniref:Uncharacterized protein n=1 Tax=Rhizophagus clarus TaxID=94130 RepID=A0A8H3LHH1_9GLOM|nr:hypothetical protein RCL_jg18462.t1 [Rhizophagus clarus]